MRLSSLEQQAIREAVRRLTRGRGQTWLFGSRTDDSARGGDIDLLVTCPDPVEQPARLMASIEMKIGERRVDVLLQAPNLREPPVHRIARATGVPL